MSSAFLATKIPTIPICVTRGSVVAVGPIARTNYASGIVNGTHNDSHGYRTSILTCGHWCGDQTGGNLSRKGVRFANAEGGGSSPLGICMGKNRANSQSSMAPMASKDHIGAIFGKLTSDGASLSINEDQTNLNWALVKLPECHDARGPKKEHGDFKEN